ncbi:unnamed protein product [Schistosoma rodhaini]|uniref:Cx9C motif-containing protein 4 n=1 Tax=Schistosoma rodhaini TaxID=6188 RepID=A0AA85EXC4_9TREM|nr:unnamed protein product [Schistosoma rodhaini]
MTDEFLFFFSDSTCSMDLPCKPLACKIQSCLIRNDFDVTRCTREITSLIECCQKFRHIKQPCCEGWDNYKHELDNQMKTN